MRVVTRLIKATGIVVIALVVVLAGALAVAGIMGPPRVAAGEAMTAPIECGPARYPVIVLPGGDGTVDQTTEQWRTVTDALRSAGYCPLTFQVRGADGNRWAADIPSASTDLGSYIDVVRQRTGASRVAIVAHSAGSVVAHHYVKVRDGAPNVDRVVLLAPETARCDGGGIGRAMGLPVKPFPVFRAVPAVPALLGRLAPSAAGLLQIAPGSPVFRSIFEDGPLTRPGVAYSVLATRADEFATPAPDCSFIDEPGVVNQLYEDLFPAAPSVDHSTLRSSPDTAGWIIQRLRS